MIPHPVDPAENLRWIRAVAAEARRRPRRAPAASPSAAEQEIAELRAERNRLAAELRECNELADLSVEGGAAFAVAEAVKWWRERDARHRAMIDGLSVALASARAASKAAA